MEPPVSIFISLIFNDVRHFFHVLIAILISSFRKCLLIFSSLLVFFFIVDLHNFLDKDDPYKDLLSDICTVNMVPNP